MEIISIKIDENSNNRFTVRQGDKYCDKLTYDEMLGVVSVLTMPKIRPCQYLRTQKEWDAMFKGIENVAQNEV